MKQHIDPASPAALYQWAAARCAQKEYCASELTQKFRQRGASLSDIESVLARLEDEGYLDESRYARAFASDKFRFDHWGRVKITYHLRHKGISSAAITEALSEIDEEEYLASLREFLQSRQRALPDAPTLDSSSSSLSPSARQKLIRAAVTRGFELELVLREMGE